MKISFIMLFFLTFQLHGATGYAQKTNVPIRLSSTTVESVLNHIEKRSEYVFLYNSKKINTNRLVSVHNKSDITEILRDIFSGTNVKYTIVDNQIILSETKLSVTQDNGVQLKGVVKDNKGEALIGVTVQIEGATNGAVTSLDGDFSIKVQKGDILVVSYIGYTTQKIKVSDSKPLSITMREDTEILDEVVVVGFGTQKKADLTGAVSSIKVDQALGNRPINNLSSALQGTMPGLEVTKGNAQPGSSPTLNIRGTNSINGGSPLVLVDNMPMDINMVNPTDIESVNVLKDASASAIYGAKAAFGVILITTKQGRKGDKVQLNYSGNFAFSKPNYLPEKASAYEDVMAFFDADQATDPNQGANVDTWLGLLKEYESNPSRFPNGNFIDDNGIIYYLAENDHFKNMMDKFGFQQTHNLSASGSTDKTTYRLSIGLSNEDGVLYLNKDTYKRYNISSFISTDMTSWLKLQADFKYADANKKRIDGGVSYGLWGNAIKAHSYGPMGGGYVDGIYYPEQTSRAAIEYGVPVELKNRNLRTLGRAIVSIVDGLTVTGEYAFIFSDSRQAKFDNIIRWYWPPNNLGQNRNNTKYQLTKSSDVTHALNVFANYDKTIGDHAINVVAGYNQEDYSYESSWMSRQDVINDALPSIGQSTGELLGGDGFSQHSTRSLFYRANYSYKGRYLIGTNGRYDGSSKFPKDSRFGFFPSVSLGWRISDEFFMNWADDYLSNLKLRFTLGEIGNQSIGAYGYIPTMSAYESNWLVNDSFVTALNAPALVSQSFTWETVQTYNYGLDLGLFDQKLDLSFDYYVRNTLDMLAPGMELPSVLGANAPKENVSDLQTKGWELAVNWSDRIGEFGYRVGFNLYDSRTYITKFDNKVGLLGNYRVGQQIGEIWGYETDRLYADADFDEKGKIKEGIAVLEGVIPNPGDVLYVDQNGDGIINIGANTTNDPGDQKILGNNSRRFQYGITAGFSYKGFDLSLFFQGIGKRDMWRSNDLVFPRYTEFSTIYKHQLDYWTPENTDAFYPRLYERATGNTESNRKIQSRYLLNGAYCSLKNITLSYTLPQKWYSKFYVDKVNLFFSGEDLWTHNNTPKGVDPEISPVEDGWGYPNMQKISIGVNITL